VEIKKTLVTRAKLSRKVILIVNSLGLSCLGGAIFLQILVFSNILMQGYFRAVETNSAVLTVELVLAVFAALYFLYIYQKVIRASLTS
jgi:hypothetical protein